jgi:SanA protein
MRWSLWLVVRITAVRLRHPPVTWAIGGLSAALTLVVAGANACVLLAAGGEAADDVADVPHAEVAIVLGAQVMPDGRMSTMLGDRVRQAIALSRARKVDRILASGAYEQPDTMRKALLAAGVPAHDVLIDRAGFNTWATMVRAQRIFDVRSAIVVTQGFHMARALYLARAAGLDAHGLTADLHGYGRAGTASDVREVLARVKAVGQATLCTTAPAR